MSADLAKTAADQETRSAKLVSRVYTLVHEETRSGRASELAVAAIECARELEIKAEQTLRLENTIHLLVKAAEKRHG